MADGRLWALKYVVQCENGVHLPVTILGPGIKRQPGYPETCQTSSFSKEVTSCQVTWKQGTAVLNMFMFNIQQVMPSAVVLGFSLLLGSLTRSVDFDRIQWPEPKCPEFPVQGRKPGEPILLPGSQQGWGWVWRILSNILLQFILFFPIRNQNKAKSKKILMKCCVSLCLVK